MATAIAPDTHKPAESTLVIMICPSPDTLSLTNAPSSRCSLCEKIFPTYEISRVHALLHHGFSSAECHFQAGHQEKFQASSVNCGDLDYDVRFYCPFPKCRFAAAPSANNTRKINQRDVSRQRINKFFEEFRYLRDHYARMHADVVMRCTKCNQKCRTHSELQQHMTHCRPEVCDCGKLVRTRCGILNHRKKCLVARGMAPVPSKKAPEVLSAAPVMPMKPILPKNRTNDVIQPARPSSILSINSCVQTTESSLSRAPRAVFSKAAQCEATTSPKRPSSAQSSSSSFSFRSSAAQTVRLHKQQKLLQIDAFTQTDLLDDNEGLSAQDASDLLMFLESNDADPIFRTGTTTQTQTNEDEMAPFLFSSTSIQTQTFGCGSDELLINLMEEDGPSDSAGLFEDLMQESVDMQTQTLEGLGNLFWDCNDAHTQTSGSTGGNYDFSFV
ncbi:uncharacterized protein LOC129593673 isoform X2 [Paramacrobiotus metropolitanus]|uniref:uncharacterized protein LOC129593673 isoform X2 n=1 Tax=Paramacrobiotus metropolitanus TaxID=2943436 RepID=UPI002445CE77|nr:uncharacterized protein LOC129593673 isoform X2 [Paramacrobiotus metropolitanus]